MRLCDVAPDGASTLVAREVFNLTHRHGHDRVEPVVPGERMLVRVPLMSTGYALPAGHTLRLAALPDLLALGVAVAGGGDAHRPRRARRAAGAHWRRLPPLPHWGPAEAAAPLESETLHAGRLGRTLTHDLATGATELAFDWIDHRTRHKASGTVLGERNLARYRLTEGDPLSAEVECATTVELERGDWAIRTEITSRMTCTRDASSSPRRWTPTTAAGASTRAAGRTRSAGRRLAAGEAPPEGEHRAVVERRAALEGVELAGHGPQQRLRALRRGVAAARAAPPKRCRPPSP